MVINNSLKFLNLIVANINTFEPNLICNLWGALGIDVESLSYNMVGFFICEFAICQEAHILEIDLNKALPICIASSGLYKLLTLLEYNDALYYNRHNYS